MLRFSPMHHEKYVLIVILARSRRMENTRKDSAGNAVIVERNSVKKDACNFREYGEHMPTENKHMPKSEGR